METRAQGEFKCGDDDHDHVFCYLLLLLNGSLFFKFFLFDRLYADD